MVLSPIARNLGFGLILLAIALLSIGYVKNESPVYSQSNLCDLVQGCLLKSQFGDIHVSATPAPIIVEQEFQFRFALKQGIRMSGHIEGINMYMGKIPLIPEPGPVNEQVFISMLGACTEPTMTWRAWLTLEDETGQRQDLYFDFQTDN